MLDIERERGREKREVNILLVFHRWHLHGIHFIKRVGPIYAMSSFFNRVNGWEQSEPPNLGQGGTLGHFNFFRVK